MDSNLEEVTEVYAASGFTIVVPLDYLSVYKVILILFTELGEDMLNDCSSICKNKGKSIVDCYAMFEAAIAAKNNGKDALADTIIHYLKEQLNLLARFNANKLSFTLPLDSTGSVNLFIEEEDDTTKLYIDKTVIDYLYTIFPTFEDLERVKEIHPVDIAGTVEQDNKTFTFTINGQVKKGSTIVYINGVRYWHEEGAAADDYIELYDNNDEYVIGIQLIEGTFEANDEIIVKGVLL